jgi:hypothetical protein
MALKMYPVTGNLTARYQWASMASDIRMYCGNNLLALMAAKTFRSPVYLYINTNNPSKPFFGTGGLIYPFNYHNMYAFLVTWNCICPRSVIRTKSFKGI